MVPSVRSLLPSFLLSALPSFPLLFLPAFPLPSQVIPKAHLRAAGDAFMAATMLERDILADTHGTGTNPFLVRLYHSFQEKDRLIMVMEYYQVG